MAKRECSVKPFSKGERTISLLFARARESRRKIAAAALAGSALLLTGAAQGNSIWTGGSTTDGNWSDGANWQGSVVPGSTSSLTNSDTATFNAAIANTWGNSASNPVVIDQPTQNIGNITFDGAAGPYFIGSTTGNSLLLSSGGTIALGSTASSFTNTATTETVNAPLVLEPATPSTSGTYSVNNNSTNATNALSLGGAISGGTTSSGVTLAVGGANTGANTIGGNLSDGNAAGGLSLTKSGAGTWALTGANSYSGSTTINAGILTIGGSGKLGGGNYSGSITNNGPAAYVNNSLYYAGLEYSSSANQTLGGTITGAGGILFNGSGSLTLSGNNNFSGGFETQNGVGSGELIINNNNALGSGTLGLYRSVTLDSTVAGGVTIPNAVVIGIAGSPLTFAGSQNLTISGNISGNGFAAVVNGSTLTLAGNISAPVSGVSSTSNNNVGTLVLSGNNSFGGTMNITSDEVAFNSNTAAGTATIEIHGGNFDNTSAGAVTMSNPVQLYGNGGTTTFVGSSSLTVGGTGDQMIGSRNFNLAVNANTLTINGNITPYSPNGTYVFTKSGAGTLVLTGANNYSQTTSVTAGALLAANGTNGSATGSDAVTIGTGNGAAILGAGSSGGAISGPVSVVNKATLQGNSTGEFTFGGNVAMASGSNFQFILNAVNSSLSPMIGASTGTLSVAGGTVVNLVNGGAEQAGTYCLVGYGANADPYADMTLTGGTTPAGFSYSLVNDTSNESVDLVVSIVPEPASTGVLLCSAMGLLCRRRRPH